MAKRKRPFRKKPITAKRESAESENSEAAISRSRSPSTATEFRFAQSIERGDLDAAIEIWEREIQPSSPSLRRMAQAAQAYAALGRYEQAIETLRSAIALAPEQPALWLGLATTQSQSGASAEAEATYREALRRHANSTLLACEFARWLYGQNRSAEALQWLEPVCQATTVENSALLLLADVYRSAQRLPEAARIYERLLERAPDHIPALRGWGVILAEQGQLAQALERLRRAVSLDASQANSWFRLGFVQRLADDLAGAIQSLRRAIELDPKCDQAWEILGRTYHELGRLDQARAVYQDWLKTASDHPIALHMLAALSGEATPDRASDAYVASVFDDFADSFEAVLRKLDYQVPRVIEEALSGMRLPANRSLQVLDAGCGTGLCGPILRPYARLLVGVDLSENMLARARQRGVFDELHHAELVAFLQRFESVYDLIVSADTLNYFGNLHPFFLAARSALSPGGQLVFTLEQPQVDRPIGQPYVLNPHGRYSHDADYVRGSIEQCGLRARRQQSVVLRKENGVPVHGWLWEVDIKA